MKTPKEKATQMIKHYSGFVHGYVGSSMLTNTEYPETIQNNAQRLSIEVCDEMIKEIEDYPYIVDSFLNKRINYWKNVRREIETINL